MAQRGTQIFSDPSAYASALGETRLSLAISHGGDFKAQVTWLKLATLEIYRCRESLPRIAYVASARINVPTVHANGA
jgi:hypothetical protein